MGAVDFAEWAAPGLKLTFGGRTYMVQPPSVLASGQILAAAIRGELELGLIPDWVREQHPDRDFTKVPAEVQEILDTIGDSHPGLGEDVYKQLADDGVPQATINRMAYYAVFYWARGKAYADALALLLWSEPEKVGGEVAGPKGS